MELRQLRYVDAVATHRHFTRAAAAIGVAQPALSHQIKRLEQELGVELFHRSRGGVRLTEAGQTLLPRIVRALSEIDAGREEISALTGLQTGRVRLGAMQALGALDLPGVLAQFHRSYPGVEVMLQEEATARMQELVAADQLDLAIVALDAGYPDTLVGLELLEEPLLLALPPGDPLAELDGIHTDQLRDHPFVLFRTGTGLRTRTDRLCQEAGFLPRVVFETGNLDRLLALVSAGLGVSLVPASSAAAARHRIEVVSFVPALTRTVGLVWRADRTLAPAAQAMRDLLAQSVQRQPLR
jgi:DNA-binding transcriptional LysR family regulator